MRSGTSRTECLGPKAGSSISGDCDAKSYLRAGETFDGLREPLLLVLRLSVGLLFIDHGLQNFIRRRADWTLPRAFLSSLGMSWTRGSPAESFRRSKLSPGVFLIVGLLGRVWAIGMSQMMLNTGLLIKLHDTHRGIVNLAVPGAEMDLLFLTILIAILILGPGRASLDAILGIERGEPSLASPQTSLIA